MMYGRPPPVVLVVRIAAAFGPVVLAITVTEVVPAPAAIDAGLKEQLVNDGNPEHPKLTAAPNAAPSGSAENV